MSSYFQGFKCYDHNYTFGKTLLVLYVKHLSSFLRETCNPASLPTCTSLPTGKDNKTQEKLKTHRKFLAGTHCIPHSGTVKHELFTWNTIIKFSKEHKTLIVSQKCFSYVAWNVYVEPDTSEEEKYPILVILSADNIRIYFFLPYYWLLLFSSH